MNTDMPMIAALTVTVSCYGGSQSSYAQIFIFVLIKDEAAHLLLPNWLSAESGKFQNSVDSSLGWCLPGEDGMFSEIEGDPYLLKWC